MSTSVFRGDYHSNRAESLKQAIMMSYDEWGPEGQGINNIESHECVMLTLLRGR